MVARDAGCAVARRGCEAARKAAHHSGEGVCFSVSRPQTRVARFWQLQLASSGVDAPTSRSSSSGSAKLRRAREATTDATPRPSSPPTAPHSLSTRESASCFDSAREAW
ncbi:MAG: hypothetical protein WDW38_002377 [Sanguina aurantia]